MARINVGRKSGFIQRGGVMRRETLWFAGAYASTGLAAASTATLITSLNAAALALRPFTVVRTRGLLLIESDQEAGDERQVAAYGECVVSDQAVAIGVTAVPTPATDNGSDLWFVHQSMFNAFRFGTAVAFQASAGTHYEIDSKAMRKVEDGSDIVSVVETASTSDGVAIQSFTRLLIKLH